MHFKCAVNIIYAGCLFLFLLTGIPVKYGYSQSPQRKLVDVVQELHQHKGTYFLFAHQSFGEKVVAFCPDKDLPVEKILQCLLSESGLSFKQVHTNTFVIIEAPD